MTTDAGNSHVDSFIEKSLILLDESPHAYILLDSEANVLRANEAAISFFHFDSLDEFTAGFFERVNSMIPIFQPTGKTSISIQERFKQVIETGNIQFESELFYNGAGTDIAVDAKRVPAGDSFFIAVCITNITTMRSAKSDMIRQDNILQSINYVATLLTAAEPEEFDLAVWESLKIMGRTVNVDRAYIWENYTEDGASFCAQTYEWSEGAEPQQGNDIVSALPYDLVPFWRDSVLDGTPINSPVRALPIEERQVLEPQGILSILVIPVLVEGEAWGFIGFDDCSNERQFSKIEEQLLTSGGILVVSAIIRNKAMADLKKQIITVQTVSRANESKTNFLARTSHEIRTPMNAIIGMAELILRENISREVRSLVYDIKQAGHSLLSIVNDILDFSKIEVGKLEITPVNYHFSSLLNDVISIIRIRAAKKNLLFTVYVDNKLPDSLTGDIVRIRQVLINILDNAVKYTDRGLTEFSVRGKAHRESDTLDLEFTIKDSGRGIKEEDFSKLFRDFVQLDMENNMGIDGTGLGLTIAKNLCKAMDGDIVVESEYGHGSTFSITLKQGIRSHNIIAEVNRPNEQSVLLLTSNIAIEKSIISNCDALGVPTNVAQTITEFEKKLSGTITHILVSHSFGEEAYRIYKNKNLHCDFTILISDESKVNIRGAKTLFLPLYTVSLANLFNDVQFVNENSLVDIQFIAPEARVLIVDDNYTNLKVASGLLRHYQMQIDTCTSGIEAIELVKKKEYDLVLMDHMMPEMDGIEATRIIRKMGEENSRFAKIPIVALSANAISGMRELYLENGMNDFLSKPIDVSKLHTIIEYWVRDKKIIPDTTDKPRDEEKGIFIDGIDTNIGLLRTGGSWDNYKEILSSFRDESLKLMKTIKSCLAEHDFSRFTTYAHSIKSSSSAIGAINVSKIAEILETAGREKNENTVNEYITPFYNMLDKLSGDIFEALAQDSKGDDAGKGDLGALKDSIELIDEMVSNMEFNDVNRKIAELLALSWPDNVREQLEALSDDILLSDFDSIDLHIALLLNIVG